MLLSSQIFGCPNSLAKNIDWRLKQNVSLAFQVEHFDNKQV